MKDKARSMKRSVFPLVILLVVSVFLGFSLIPPNTIKVLASSTDTFSFTFAKNITTFTLNFQNITNSYNFPVNIRIYVQTVNNLFKLRNFTLLVNGTIFILILDGVITQNENVFYGLQQSETLVYDASATPIPTINNGDTVTINYVTEIYESVVPIPPVPPLPPVHIFDVKITSLPSIVTYIPVFSTSFPATINVFNKGIDTDATIKWEILDMQGQVITSEKFTVFIKSSENKTLTFTVPTPDVAGAYTLNAQVISPASAFAQKSLNVVVFPIATLLAILVLIGFAITMIVLRKTKKL